MQPVVAKTKPARQMGELKANDVAVLYNSLLFLNHMDNMWVFWEEDYLICNLLIGSRPPAVEKVGWSFENGGQSRSAKNLSTIVWPAGTSKSRRKNTNFIF